MHIGFLIQDFPPEVGAGAARALEFAHQWQRRGANVTVITAMPNRRLPGRGEGGIDPAYKGALVREEIWDGVRTIRTWLYASDRRGFARTLVNHTSFAATSALNLIARAERFDVLVASGPPLIPQFSAAVVARTTGMPFVLDIRDLWPDYLVEMGMLDNALARRAVFAMERWLLRQAEHVVVVTESFRRRIIEKGIPADRTSVIPNGVELDRYQPAASANRPEVLAGLGGDFLVGYLGTFGAGQQLSTVIDAARIVASRDPSIRFALVGDGPDRPAVAARLAETGIENVLIKPPIPRDQTTAFYNACDVCLVPLAPLAVFSETVPSKIFEIMACERPIIAGLRGEGARVLESSGAGVRVDPGDPAALAEAILALRSRSAEERQAMGRRGREYVAAHYDRRVLADRYLELLTTVVSGGRTMVKSTG